FERDGGGGLVLVTWRHLAFACRKPWWRTQDGDQAKRLGITLVLCEQVAVLYHHRKIAEHVHKLYELGYKTLIRGSAVGMEKMAKKKNKSKPQALSAVYNPKKSGESSSHQKNSKSSTTHRPRRLSPPPMCLMALGNNDVSDDSSSKDESDVETNEMCEMMTLLHNQQEYLTKQNEEIKTLKAKEKLHASFVSRYENLLNKFNLLDNEHKELKMKYESLESKSESSSDKSFPCNIPCAISFEKVDASTSCDLTPCNENVIVETCDDLIAKENDELKQEVERLMTDLRWLKGKYTQEQVQPSQDNTYAGVKKLEKGETVTCFKCHKEGHKSYQCKEKGGKENSKNLNKNKKAK